MKEKKRDKSIVKEAIGDPAFYNDQIDEKKDPLKARMEYKTRIIRTKADKTDR